MPLYDYRCKSCRHRFELQQSFSSEPIADCPVCGSPAGRLISPVAIHFKGNGFYKTDNRSGNSRSSNGAGKPESGERSEKGKGASSDGSSESKVSSGASSDGSDA